MNAAEITAICTGIPAIIGAITALIVAIRAKNAAKVNTLQIANHIEDPSHP